MSDETTTNETGEELAGEEGEPETVRVFAEQSVDGYQRGSFYEVVPDDRTNLLMARGYLTVHARQGVAIPPEGREEASGRPRPVPVEEEPPEGATVATGANPAAIPPQVLEGDPRADTTPTRGPRRGGQAGAGDAPPVSGGTGVTTTSTGTTGAPTAPSGGDATPNS